MLFENNNNNNICLKSNIQTSSVDCARNIMKKNTTAFGKNYPEDLYHLT